MPCATLPTRRAVGELAGGQKAHDEATRPSTLTLFGQLRAFSGRVNGKPQAPWELGVLEAITNHAQKGHNM